MPRHGSQPIVGFCVSTRTTTVHISETKWILKNLSCWVSHHTAHTYTHTHARAHICTDIHIHTHTGMSKKYVYSTHMHKHARTYTYTHTYTHECVQKIVFIAHTRAHMHTRTLTYTHTHPHTHTQVCPRRCIHEVTFLEPLGGQQTQEHPPCPLPSMSFFCAFSFVISSSVPFFFSACLAFLFLYFSLSSSQSSIPFQPYNNHSATICVHSTF